ncbi:hypothetical protein [Kitasatospora cheerisanensis]|uniref:Uncharacterized protein n=1 Tax=Kitasatospora cheerisanensis KCTC 2395 TaxID=1348663 RepID=A0A066YKL2_9ACTN|nr:hypothetical protein [Kitasatospora cheerisanensis]KDN80479.1 hypothetical protein KCH_77670 [Kitasatospora cheerisanensis KCTC 2395]
MNGSERQAPSEEQSASVQRSATTSRDVRHHTDSQTVLERGLRKGGVVFDFVGKLASAGYWVFRLLKVLDLL